MNIALATLAHAARGDWRFRVIAWHGPTVHCNARAWTWRGAVKLWADAPAQSDKALAWWNVWTWTVDWIAGADRYPGWRHAAQTPTDYAVDSRVMTGR